MTTHLSKRNKKGRCCSEFKQCIAYKYKWIALVLKLNRDTNAMYFWQSGSLKIKDDTHLFNAHDDDDMISSLLNANQRLHYAVLVIWSWFVNGFKTSFFLHHLCSFCLILLNQEHHDDGSFYQGKCQHMHNIAAFYMEPYYRMIMIF